MTLLACLWICLAQAAPWEPVPMPDAASGKTLRGLATLDGKSGWMVGDAGLCLQTKDGGRTWVAGFDGRYVRRR